MTKEQFLNIDKKNTIVLNHGSSLTNNKKVELLPVSKPRFSERYNLHKLTLKNKENLNGCKYYAYLRGDKVSFAFGDMGISVSNIEVIKQP